ncbi:hypothetical protein QQ045_000518 [Rhodiola kirilowii]
MLEYIIFYHSFGFWSIGSPLSNKFRPPLEDGTCPSSELRKLEIEVNEVAYEEEGIVRYCFTSTIMLSLTTADESSGDIQFIKVNKKTDKYGPTISRQSSV